MKLPVKMYVLMITTILALNVLIPKIVQADSNEKIQKIEQFVEEQRKKSKIPGMSVVIVEKGQTVYQKGFGYADIEAEIPVTNNTLFEIGSTTKAFTGLAILQLEKEGRLKRSEDVRKYIPWLELKYNGEPQTVTIDQLLHHTSGIPSATIVHIPESNDDHALEMTVRTLLNQPLNRKQGSSFEYATINYDVLGLVIENVSKQPYDLYIKQHILAPADMNESFVGLHQVNSTELATGYKIGFKKEQIYIPPIYRGNIPAGYVISNTNDIAKWMKLQLGSKQSSTIDAQIIQESHMPDQSVEPFEKDTYYAGGWSITKKDDKQYISHAGANPTFSAHIIMQPDQQIGVAVLSNMNSTFTTAISQNIMDLWEGNSVNNNLSDGFQILDEIATILCIIVSCLGAIFILILLRITWKLVRKQRIRVALNVKRTFVITIHSLLVATIVTLTLMTPKILLGGLNWEFIEVWGPTSISMLFYSVICASIIYYLLGLILIFTRKI
ncbi:serine hydrolase domain-containing protein [Solibacillus cecembensis]|uniref:serine hydrolase domain-containing protein n=1 Tax=Solibacillus cecembensis TaxID=459347 RepID=UPI003D05783F